MKSIHLLLSLVILAFLSQACGGPFVLLPGGALDGEASPTPSDWSFSDDVSTVQLESRPADPYSVNIWAVGLKDAIYVHAGANRAAWVDHMEEDPRVRVRIADQIFSLQAARVTSAEEFLSFADAYEEKYGTRPRNETIAEIYLYRLADRDAL